jgi:hypothetical protein
MIVVFVVVLIIIIIIIIVVVVVVVVAVVVVVVVLISACLISVDPRGKCRHFALCLFDRCDDECDAATTSAH